MIIFVFQFWEPFGGWPKEEGLGCGKIRLVIKTKQMRIIQSSITVAMCMERIFYILESLVGRRTSYIVELQC